MRVKCLYCDEENDALATSGYCESCGKKLPSSAMVRTRRAITSDSEGGGRDVASAVSRSPTVEALYTTAVVQLVVGGLFLVLGPTLFRAVPEQFLPLVVLWTVLPTVFLASLAAGAGSYRRGVTITALVGYAVWIVVGFTWNPTFATAWLVVHAVIAGLLGWVAWIGLRSPQV